MAPLLEPFPASEIPRRMHIQTKNFEQKRRKGTPKYLDECPLYELVQYSCNPPDREPPPPGHINCESFMRQWLIGRDYRVGDET
ncbi:hypothetical protein KEM56_000022 [Ascosphaera pollenicola]|nr:hypothetical protein KEM56_000022 [Ascosphaera pollenicola]